MRTSETAFPTLILLCTLKAAPTPGAVVAWAGYCALDQNGRPANISPKFLAPKNHFEMNTLVRTAVHELLHALGFSAAYIASSWFRSKNAVIKQTASPFRGGGGGSGSGRNATLFTGPAALAAARKAFNCPSTALDGVEFEDEGGSSTAGSHWERRFHKEDVMAGIVGDVMTISEMTFGLLEDSGHYTINRANLEEEHMRGVGCGVFGNKCNTNAGGRGKYFCFDEDSGNDYCTSDYKGIGVCGVKTYPTTAEGTSELPRWAQYFDSGENVGGSAGLMNYCPVVRPFKNKRCNVYDSGDSNNTNIGLYFGSDSRCFRTSPTLAKRGSTVAFSRAAPRW